MAKLAGQTAAPCNNRRRSVCQLVLLGWLTWLALGLQLAGLFEFRLELGARLRYLAGLLAGWSWLPQLARRREPTNFIHGKSEQPRTENREPRAKNENETENENESKS